MLQDTSHCYCPDRVIDFPRRGPVPYKWVNASIIDFEPRRFEPDRPHGLFRSLPESYPLMFRSREVPISV